VGSAAVAKVDDSVCVVVTAGGGQVPCRTSCRRYRNDILPSGYETYCQYSTTLLGGGSTRSINGETRMWITKGVNTDVCFE
jgi:hypothetical protein